MEEIQTAIRKYTEMGDVEQQIRLGIGAAAAAAAIFAPLSYKWKSVLTAIATESILTGIYRSLRSGGTFLDSSQLREAQPPDLGTIASLSAGFSSPVERL